MPNSMFSGRNDSSLVGKINSIRAQGPSKAVFDRMYSSDPRFRAFANSVRGKTPEQAFRENGLDFSRFSGFRW